MHPADYLNGLFARLAADGSNPVVQQWGGQSVLVAHRAEFKLRWMATKLHLFVIACEMPEVSVDHIIAFDQTAAQFARDNKGGMPLGFQTGVAVFPALVSARVDPNAGLWAAERQRVNFACMSRPVVVDTSRATVSQFRGSVALGAVYSGYLKAKSAQYFPLLTMPIGDVLGR